MSFDESHLLDVLSRVSPAAHHPVPGLGLDQTGEQPVQLWLFRAGEVLVDGRRGEGVEDFVGQPAWVSKWVLSMLS